MKRRVRAAALIGAIGAAMFVLLPFASLARADGPALAGLSLDGTARGLQVTVGFKDFILGNVVDIASPHAHSELSSTGSGTSRAVAAQLFPGDIVAGNGQARERIPGFREANYPAPSAKSDPAEAEIDKDDDTYAIGPLNQTAGPISIASGHLKTHASADTADSLVASQRFELAGSSGPLLRMTAMETTSNTNGTGSTIVQQARTTIKNLIFTVSDQLSISIGSIDAVAQSSSDGVAGEAVATFTISNAEVILNGQHFKAAIDNDGIKLEGISGAPPAIPMSPSTATEVTQRILQQYGVSITTSAPVRIVNGAAADATVGGLLIAVRGAIPSVFTPDQAAELIDMVYKRTEGLRSRELCPEGNPIASSCTLNGVCPFAAAPLCVTPAVVPGPGQGFMTSFAIGLAHAAASAAPAFEFGPPLPPGEFGGGTFGGGTGEFVTQPGGSFTENAAPNGSGPARAPQLFGLVAKMPPGALLGAGTALVVLAVAIAFGPSLRPEGRAGR